MSKLLGLLDALESMILEGPRVPLSNKILVKEDKFMELVEKMRITIKDEENLKRVMNQRETYKEDLKVERKPKTKEIEDAEKSANQIKQEAREYAEYILSNLQLTMAKVQRQLYKVEQNLETSKDLLKTQTVEKVVEKKDVKYEARPTAEQPVKTH